MKHYPKWKERYTSHKYQVYNDIYHCPIIFSRIPLAGAIYHMDFSENSQMHKYEPQSSHFNKSHYSLHCTVKHDIHEEEPIYTYIYHLSDVSIITMHSLQLLFIISSAYSHRLILYDLSLTIAQYNINPNMFYFWQSRAKYLDKKCLVY